MTKDLNFGKLKALVQEVFGVNEIDLSTEVNKLNSVSEDNDRFIELFQSEFKVNMDSFPYYKYFEEDEFILLSLLKKLFGRIRKKKMSLTVNHLLIVINRGEWIEQE
jgi:hypothetical protein